jgi:hypothetical protein
MAHKPRMLLASNLRKTDSRTAIFILENSGRAAEFSYQDWVVMLPEAGSKNAYLVLAHHDALMLNALIQRLVATGEVFAHLDRKSKLEVIDVTSHPKVKVYKELRVNWVVFQWCKPLYC